MYDDYVPEIAHVTKTPGAATVSGVFMYYYGAEKIAVVKE